MVLVIVLYLVAGDVGKDRPRQSPPLLIIPPSINRLISPRASSPPHSAFSLLILLLLDVCICLVRVVGRCWSPTPQPIILSHTHAPPPPLLPSNRIEIFHHLALLPSALPYCFSASRSPPGSFSFFPPSSSSLPSFYFASLGVLFEFFLLNFFYSFFTNPFTVFYALLIVPYICPSGCCYRGSRFHHHP